MEGLFPVSYSCDLKFNSANMQITSEIPDEGETIVKFKYHAQDNDEAGAGGGMGATSNSCDYWANVVAKGNVLEVESGYVAHIFVRNTQTTADADTVNKVYADRLELAVDVNGKMVVHKTSTVKDGHYGDGRAAHQLRRGQRRV